MIECYYVQADSDEQLEYRCVAQFGRALRSGRRGRWFKSSRIDANRRTPLGVLFFAPMLQNLDMRCLYDRTFGTQRFKMSSGHFAGSNPVASTARKGAVKKSFFKINLKYTNQSYSNRSYSNRSYQINHIQICPAMRRKYS